MIYLDYNSTAPLRPEALEAMVEVLTSVGNPSAPHQAGRRAKHYLENARQTIGKIVNLDPKRNDYLCFTSGASEANTLLFRGLGGHVKTILRPATEHSSVINNSREAITIPLINDNTGLINLDNLAQLLQSCAPPTLVSVMLVNSQTGVIQPIKEIAKLAQKYNALFHCDAVQAIGKKTENLPLDFTELGPDFMTIAAHKFGGPVGIGGLIIKNHQGLLQPIIHGGGQERGLRPGIENLAAIVGFAAALKASQSDDFSLWRQWQQKFEATIKDNSPAIIVGEAASRVPTTSCIIMPNVEHQKQLMLFDLADFCISAGSVCQSGTVHVSPLLLAAGFSPELAKCAIRVSFGWNSKLEELEQFAQQWLKIFKQNPHLFAN